MSDVQIDPLERARAACAANDWTEAYEILHAADERRDLSPDGLELLADCARWTGHAEVLIETLARAHHGFAARGDDRAAARTALALCHAHADVCEEAVSAGWWQRAGELLDGLPESAEHALHAWFTGRTCGMRGDVRGHEHHARRALVIARRVGDRNAEALALVDVAHASGAHGEGDEAMAALERATALALGGEIGVMEAGIVYCNAIWTSRSRGEWQRAREWCDSASRWVERIRVAYFPGLCRVHRAEVLRFRGELGQAEREAEEAIRLLERATPRWISLALAELGEIRRRRGDLAGAMNAFRRSLERGWDPQPGLSRLLLAQGDAEAAHRALERALHRPPTTLCEDRANLLLARASIAVAAGRGTIASEATAELEQLAERNRTPWERASAAQARGEVLLAQDRPGDAAPHLARARATWAELEAPFELAVCGAELAEALARDGDAGGARLELEAARGILARIGAAHELERLDAALRSSDDAPGRTPGAGPDGDGDGEATLRREGDYWTLAFDGAVLHLRDGRGPRYLAELLARPGEDVLAVELASGTSGGARPTGDAGELLDVEARGAYRRRLAELQADLAEAEDHHDLGRAERLRGERDALAGELARAVGLGGRARRAGDPAERARQSVTKALRGLVRKVEAEAPALGRYLRNTLRTGTACRFEPDPGRPMRWSV